MGINTEKKDRNRPQYTTKFFLTILFLQHPTRVFVMTLDVALFQAIEERPQNQNIFWTHFFSS